MDTKHKKASLGIIGVFFLASFFGFSQANAASSSGYVYESIAFYAYKAEQTGTVPVYRYYNSSSGDNYYTTNNSTPSGYASKGIAFFAYKAEQTGTVPVYRMYNSVIQDHFYTVSETEKDKAIDNRSYKSEGIAFYAYEAEQSGTSAIYRLYSSKTGDHLYTASEDEKNSLIEEGEDELGPEIAVGLWEATTKDAKKNSFKIKANREYLIKDKDGDTLGKIPAGTTTKIKYAGDKKLKIYNSIKEITVKKEVSFVASDGQNDLMIFDTSRPNSSYDQYRGKIKIRYSDASKSIWVINTLPMEHYVWGMGETTGTGDIEHTKVMTTIFRTYGYWYLEYATKYLPYGFKIKSNSGSQIYWGYDWETKYPNIKKAAKGTEGRVATYKDEDEIALTPYSSWSDGKTRSFKERWGSSDYPWCKSVKDPYGKHSSLSTKKLEAAGNHMVGLIGNGSVKLASKYDWSYSKILKYYYTGIDLTEKY